MTKEELNNKLKHFITCLKCEVSGKECDDNCPTQYDAGNMGKIIENLEAISKTLEQTRWIPVSERMPEDPLVTGKYEEYLVTDAKGHCGVGFYHYKAKAWDSVNWGWLEREDKVDNKEAFVEPSGIGKVVAWMPLPEPYKAESEGEE